MSKIAPTLLMLILTLLGFAGWMNASSTGDNQHIALLSYLTAGIAGLITVYFMRKSANRMKRWAFGWIVYIVIGLFVIGMPYATQRAAIAFTGTPLPGKLILSKKVQAVVLFHLKKRHELSGHISLSNGKVQAVKISCQQLNHCQNMPSMLAIYNASSQSASVYAMLSDEIKKSVDEPVLFKTVITPIGQQIDKLVH